MVSQKLYFANTAGPVFVTVFDDVKGNGTEWLQVGDSLEAVAIDQLNNESVTVRRCGEAVAMSKDGAMIVVSAPYTSRLFREGLVQAYELAANGTTWIPLGQILFGEYDDKLGEKMALAGNGERLVLSNRIGDSESTASFHTYELVDGQWEPRFQYLGVGSEMRTYHTSRDSDVVAISQDGLVVAISAADDSPSAYSDTPYQGEAELYKWNDRRKEFEFIDKL